MPGQGRGARATIALGAVAMMLSGCRTMGADRAQAGTPSLAMIVEQPIDGGPGSARVDDRRWLAIPAAGTVDVVGVAPGLELDGLVFESISRPGSVRAVSCTVHDPSDPLLAPWIIGHRVTLTTVRGAEVTGAVAEVTSGLGPDQLGDGDGDGDGDTDAGDEVEAEVGDEVDGDAAGDDRAVGSDDQGAADGERDVDLAGSLVVDSVVVHDDAGMRHAIRGDAIASLRVADLPPVPTLRCRVTTSAPGRHAVRIAYRVPGVGWTVRYRVTAIDDAATAVTVVPYYALVATGLPSADRPIAVVLQASPIAQGGAPVEVWRGTVATTAGAVELVGTSSSRPARVRYRYRGSDPDADAVAAVWRELVFERIATDAPGELAVSTAAPGGPRWYRQRLGPALPGTRLVRIPLAVEPTLVGFRELIDGVDDEDAPFDEVRFSVANRGPRSVTVLVEEPLRDRPRPVVRFAAPAGGVLSAGRWQLELEVAPGGVARAAVALQYDAAP